MPLGYPVFDCLVSRFPPLFDVNVVAYRHAERPDVVSVGCDAVASELGREEVWPVAEAA